MGKFEGVLLCTDLDDTLLRTDKSVSEENINAIEYFKSEGGNFTFSTGRSPVGISPVLEYVKPNVPIVCFNGAGIYDLQKEELIYLNYLDDEAIKCIEYMDNSFDYVGIEVLTKDKTYFCKVNEKVREHQQEEKLPDNFADYHDIEDKWVKALFMADTDKIPVFREMLANSPFADKYEFMQSDPCYYEILPKNASKGDGVLKLAEILGVDKKRTIGIGDNENDLKLVKMTGIGVAVSNAVDVVRNAADVITVDNNSNAIAAIIKALDDGTLTV